MLDRAMRVVVLVSSPLFLSGCEYIGEFNFMPPQNTDSTHQNRASVDDSMQYSRELSHLYLTSAGFTVNEEQAFDLTTIGAAATAGAGALFKWSTRIISDAGLVAGTSYALRTYYNGDARAKALVSASLALSCVQTVGASLQSAGEKDNVDASDAWDAVDAIEQRVFQQFIARTPPDFASLAKALSAQVGKAETSKAAHNLVSSPKDDAPAQYTACIAKAG